MEVKELTREEEEARADAVEDPTVEQKQASDSTVAAAPGIRLLTTDADWPMLHVYHQWKKAAAPAAPSESKGLPPDKRRKKADSSALRVTWDNDSTVLGLSIPVFIEVLRSQFHFSSDIWLALCILFECDYFEKSWATKQVGHDVILEAVVRFARATRGHKRTPLLMLEGFRDLLVHIYARKLGCLPQVGEVLAAKRPAAMDIKLHPDALAEAFVRFRLAYDYFAYMRCWSPEKDPTQGGKIRVDVVEWLAAMQI